MEIRGTLEVILSAGSIGSPQILLSGVGPAAQLAAAQAELPGVGGKMKDHFSMLLRFPPRQHRSQDIGSLNAVKDGGPVLQMFLKGVGPLASSAYGGTLFTRMPACAPANHPTCRSRSCAAAGTRTSWSAR